MRASRFRSVRDRDRYLRAHAAVRQLLARHTGIAAHAVKYVAGAFGKPALARSPRGCHFNLAHSGDIAIVAICDDGEVGVDVEVLREVPDADALTRSVFTTSECNEFALAPSDQRDRAFLRGWTRKEACMKATGHGLNLAPSTFDVGMSPGRRHVLLPRLHTELCVESFERRDGVIGSVARQLRAAPTTLDSPRSRSTSRRLLSDSQSDGPLVA